MTHEKTEASIAATAATPRRLDGQRTEGSEYTNNMSPIPANAVSITAAVPNRTERCYTAKTHLLE